MIFSQDRLVLRTAYYEAWQKQLQKKPLNALEQQLVDVMAEHPEYHEIITIKDHLDKDWSLEHANPFLHLGLHIALREQLIIGKPDGIRQQAQRLLAKTQDSHQTEHMLMQCLAEAVWQTKEGGADMEFYMACVGGL